MCIQLSGSYALADLCKIIILYFGYSKYVCYVSTKAPNNWLINADYKTASLGEVDRKEELQTKDEYVLAI